MSEIDPARQDLLLRYRTLRQALHQHLNAALKCARRSDLKDAARRIGLTIDGNTIAANHASETNLAYDLAVFGQKTGSARAIDLYAASASYDDGTPEAITLKALQAAVFRVIRVKQRHKALGNIVQDAFHQGELWLIDEGLEMSSRSEQIFALRLIPIDRFHTTVGAIVPLSQDTLTAAMISLAAKRGKFDQSSGDDPNLPETIYATAIEFGIMKSMTFADS